MACLLWTWMVPQRYLHWIILHYSFSYLSRNFLVTATEQQPFLPVTLGSGVLVCWGNMKWYHSIGTTQRGRGAGGSKPLTSRILNSSLTPLFSWLPPFSLFLIENIMHCCIIFPLFLPLPTLLELPPTALPRKYHGHKNPASYPQANSGQFSHIHVFHSLYFIPYIVLKDDVWKASLTFASGSLVGVRCKLVQSVVYCVWFVMMSTNIEKTSAVSEEGHVLTAWEN